MRSMVGNEEKKIYRKNVIWNAIAGLINALEAVIVIAVVSRVNSLKDAGVLTLAFSLANLYMTIGKFGMRNYQVAHDGEDFRFKTFLHSRVITVGIMILVVIIDVVYNFVTSHYTIQKASVVFFVCMWYAVEAFEDVFVGKFQALGRLDIGSRIFSIRWSFTIITFVISDFIWRDIVIASVLALLTSMILGGFLIINTCLKSLRAENIKVQKGLIALFRESTVLCVAAFLYFYTTNIPKYAIDLFLGDEVQAIYGYISMPVFVVALLNSFIYQPQLTAYVLEWRENKTKQFVSRVSRQLLMIVLIILICILGAYILGIPILSILYNEDLSNYKVYLLILILGGGFLALGGYMETMLVIINEQNKGTIGYLITAIVGYILVNLLVRKYHLLGAVCGYTITMFLMSSIFSFFLIYTIRKRGAE